MLVKRYKTSNLYKRIEQTSLIIECETECFHVIKTSVLYNECIEPVHWQRCELERKKTHKYNHRYFSDIKNQLGVQFWTVTFLNQLSISIYASPSFLPFIATIQLRLWCDNTLANKHITRVPIAAGFISLLIFSPIYCVDLEPSRTP